MQCGDVVVALGAKRLDGLADTRVSGLAAHLQKTVRGMFEGEVLGVTVVRGAETVELSVEIAAASERDQIRIDAEELLGLSLVAGAEHPTIARLTQGTQIWGDPDMLVGATLRSVMGTDVAGYEDLAERLGEMRRMQQQRGGSPRVLVGFEKDGDTHAALLRLAP